MHDRARQIGCPSRISPPDGAMHRDQCLYLFSRHCAMRKQVSLQALDVTEGDPAARTDLLIEI